MPLFSIPLSGLTASSTAMSTIANNLANLNTVGYKGSNKENSWLPATKLDHAQELLSDFHFHYPHKSGPNLSLVHSINSETNTVIIIETWG